jgi:hypothetical protein
MRFGLIIVFISLVNKGICQIWGCIDPLAVNFNGSANKNDGSCTYNTTTIKPYSSVVLQNYLVEFSGLVNYNGSLWGHNDNSDRRLYQIDSVTGFALRSIKMNGGLNRDWEDVCSDDSFIYVGDFGNNYRGNRRDLTIYKWKKSELLDSFVVADSIRFIYPEQLDFTELSPNSTNFDCEAMVSVGDSLYLFTKEWNRQGSTIYRLSKSNQLQTANKIGYLSVGGLITGATYLQKYHAFVLVGYSDLLQPFLYLLYDLEGNDFARCNKRKILVDLPFYQMEAIAFVDSYVVALGNERFVNAFIKTEESLQFVNLSFLLGDYYGRKLNTVNFVDAMMRFDISHNPCVSGQKSRLIVKGANRCLPVNQEVKILTETGAEVSTFYLSTDSVELPDLASGLYLVGNLQLGFVKWSVH